MSLSVDLEQGEDQQRNPASESESYSTAVSLMRLSVIPRSRRSWSEREKSTPHRLHPQETVQPLNGRDISESNSVQRESEIALSLLRNHRVEV